MRKFRSYDWSNLQMWHEQGMFNGKLLLVKMRGNSKYLVDGVLIDPNTFKFETKSGRIIRFEEVKPKLRELKTNQKFRFHENDELRQVDHVGNSYCVAKFLSGHESLTQAPNVIFQGDMLNREVILVS